MGFPGSSVGEESTCNVGDPGSIPGLERPPGERKGYTLQYSGLENFMDCIVHGGRKELDTAERLSLSLQDRLRLPRWLSGKESTCQCRRHRRCGFKPWVRKIPWRRKWQPTPVVLPGKSHGQRSLVGHRVTKNQA